MFTATGECTLQLVSKYTATGDCMVVFYQRLTRQEPGVFACIVYAVCTITVCQCLLTDKPLHAMSGHTGSYLHLEDLEEHHAEKERLTYDVGPKITRRVISGVSSTVVLLSIYMVVLEIGFCFF